MKRATLAIALVLAAALALPVMAADTGKIKIAVILPSTKDDLAWSQALYAGVKKVVDELGPTRAEMAVSENLWKEVDAGTAIREYASKGYNIIFAHGAQYQSVLAEVAPDFPDVTFAYGTAFATPEPNIFAYDPQAQQGAYLMGIIAAKLTRTGIIGIVGPVEAGDAIMYNKGFVQGVAATNPKAVVKIAYTGSFGDSVKAGEIAKTHLQQGADILTGTSQQAPGGIRAVAEQKGKYWLSSDYEQSSVAPKTVLVSQVYHFENLVKQIISLRAQKVYGGKRLEMDYANGGIELVYNTKLSVIPRSVKDAVEAAKKDIIAGKIVVKVQ